MTIWWMAIAAAARPPDAFDSCDLQAAYFTAQPRPRPARRPALWWIENDPACPEGSRPHGEPPPSGHEVSCIDGHGHLYGPQSFFDPDGRVVQETQWEHNREIGPRLEWDAQSSTLVRQTGLRSGRVDGETVAWLSDGGVLVTTWDRGGRTGPTWTVDERGQLMLLENWRNGDRHGRSCAWRDSTWIEQVWVDGEPAAMQ